MTKIIAVANHKGGVGKTTTVASLGAILSDMGKRILLVDLDSQSNLTTSLYGKEPEQTIYNALRGQGALPVVKLADRLSLVPSSLDMAGIELEVGSVMQREYLLKDLLEPLQARFDYILLDCPPSLGLIVINAFVAATDVFIPLTAEALPFKGLVKITDIIKMVQRRLNPSLELSGIFITRWERSKLAQQVEEALRAQYGDIVYKTKIRKNISIAEAPLTGKDILSYAPSSNGAKDYKALALEITENSNTNNIDNTINNKNNKFTI